MASATDATAIITQVANQLGIPPALAIAMAQQESGLNPNAVGDNGTSFGLYQLHEGGELGSMSPSSVMGPNGEYQNALTSLSELASVMHQHPGMDPGELAALAQRPANQGAYAAGIDRLMGQPSSANASEYAQGGGTGSMLGAPNQAQFMSQLMPNASMGSGLDPQVMQSLMSVMGMQGINPYAPQMGQFMGMPGQNSMMPGEGQGIQLMDYTTPNGTIPYQQGPQISQANQGGYVPDNMFGVAGQPNTWTPSGPQPVYPPSISPAQEGNMSTFQPWMDVALGAVEPNIEADILKSNAATANQGFLTNQTQLGQLEASQGYQNTLAQLGLQRQAADIQGGALARQGALLPQEKSLQEQLFGISGQQLADEKSNVEYQSGRSLQSFQGSEAASGASYTPGEKQGEGDIAQAEQQQLQSIGLAGQQLGVQESQYGLSYNEQLAQLQDAIKNLGLTTGPGGYLALAGQQAGQNLANTNTGLAEALASGLYNYQNQGSQAMAGAAGLYNQAAASVAYPAMAGQIMPYFQGTQGGYLPTQQGQGNVFNPGFVLPGANGQYGPPPTTAPPPKKP